MQGRTLFLKEPNSIIDVSSLEKLLINLSRCFTTDLAENCNYGDQKGELIRNRLVVGIRDMALPEQLQLYADLMLERAKKAIRQ